MERPVSHPEHGRFDLASVSAGDMQFLTALYNDRPAAAHGLTCEMSGGDRRLYVYKTHGDGHLSARHFPGGTCGSNHAITPETDEHKRFKNYCADDLVRLGIPADTEVSTNNRTRHDAATLDALRIVGVEVQRGAQKDSEYRRRATLAMRATAFTGKHARPLPDGVLPVWLHPAGVPHNWTYPVPSIAAQDTHWNVMPKPGSVAGIGVRSIEAEQCRIGSRWQVCPRSRRGHCWGVHPIAVLQPRIPIGEVIAKVATGEYVPLRYYTGVVYLVDTASAALYAELGGQGEYLAGTPSGPTTYKLGACKSPQHDPPVPIAPEPPVRIQPSPPAPPPVVIIRPKPAPAPIKVQPKPAWRCVRCGALTRTDPCPACASWHVLPSNERVPLGICCTCGQEHDRCEFTSGSLDCVAPNCRSPHHRQPAYLGDRTA